MVSHSKNHWPITGTVSGGGRVENLSESEMQNLTTLTVFITVYINVYLHI